MFFFLLKYVANRISGKPVLGGKFPIEFPAGRHKKVTGTPEPHARRQVAPITFCFYHSIR